jgi:hypothetical protein
MEYIEKFKVFVSRDGRVFKFKPKTKIYREYKIQTCKLGYKRLALKSEDKRENVSVHRLVATAYVPNPDNLSDVNHKDGVKANNQDTNLEWCSHKENVRHAWETGLITFVGQPEKPARNLKLVEMYNSGEYSFEDLGVAFGVSKTRARIIYKTYMKLHGS